MTTPATVSTWEPRLRSVLRIVAAFLFLQHGTHKLFGWPGEGGGGVELMSQMGLGAVLELGGGLLLLIGLFTRPTAFLLSGMMAVAYWQFHADFEASSFGGWPLVNQGELAVLYCFTWLYFCVAGPGPWSVDAKRAGGR